MKTRVMIDSWLFMHSPKETRIYSVLSFPAFEQAQDKLTFGQAGMTN